MYNITITGNTIIENPNIWTPGRGISVVGGKNITINGNYVTGTPLGGIYIAAEPAYETLGVNGVTASGNTIVSCGGYQGAVTVYNGEGSAGTTVAGVSITDNQIINPGYVAFQFAPSTGSITATVTNNQIYDPPANGNINTDFDLGGNPILTQSGNTLVSTYPNLLVSPGGGVSIRPSTPPPPPPPPAAVTDVAATEANVTVAAINAVVNAASGNHKFFISGNTDTFNLSGGTETITDSGSGGNTFNLPAAGGGKAIFNSAVLTNGDVFNLATALASTNWSGSASSLPSYLHTRQAANGTSTQLLVSQTATTLVSGTVLAIFRNTNASLSAILAHSIT